MKRKLQLKLLSFPHCQYTEGVIHTWNATKIYLSASQKQHLEPKMKAFLTRIITKVETDTSDQLCTSAGFYLQSVTTENDCCYEY